MTYIYFYMSKETTAMAWTAGLLYNSSMYSNVYIWVNKRINSRTSDKQTQMRNLHKTTNSVSSRQSFVHLHIKLKELENHKMSEYLRKNLLNQE